jgi:hypothetical protein
MRRMRRKGPSFPHGSSEIVLQANEADHPRAVWFPIKLEAALPHMVPPNAFLLPGVSPALVQNEFQSS